MKTITVGREFGSGGREFGLKLAKKLGFAYYDREIITEIAKKTELAEEYVENILEKSPSYVFPFHTSVSFTPAYDPTLQPNNAIYAKQTDIIREMAAKSSCVIVGRCADYILAEQNPFRIFVYSDKESRMRRCRENAPDGEQLTDKELWKKIQGIDKNRRKYYNFFTGGTWGDKKEYDLLINTAVGTIDEWVDFVSALLQKA